MEEVHIADGPRQIVNQSRRTAVERAPRWYFPSTGIVLGLALTVVLLRPGIWAGVAVILMALSLRVLEAFRRHQTGIRRSEFRDGPGTAYVVAAMLLGLATIAVGCYCAVELKVAWTAWVAGALLFTITYVGGRLFERATLGGTRER